MCRIGMAMSMEFPEWNSIVRRYWLS